MAIAYRSQASLPNQTRTTTTVNMPAGVQAGDTVLVFCATGNSSEVAITPPASLSSNPVTNRSYSDASPPWTVNMRIYRYAVVGSGDPASFAFTHASAGSEALAIAFSGVDATTPIDVTPTTNSGMATTAIALGLTTTVNAAWLVVWRGSWDGNPITPPAGWTERLDQPVTWVAHREWATAGATGDFSIPAGNGGAYPYGTILIPLRPAGSGGTQYAASGVAASTSTTTATVRLRAAVAATVAAVSVASGAVTALRPSSGTVATTNTVAGAVTSLLPASGSVASTSAATGSAAVQSGAQTYPAAGTVAATSSVAGAVTSLLPANGVAAVVSTTTGAAGLLPGGSLVAQGTVVSVSLAAGVIHLRAAAAGAAVCLSTTAGSPAARLVATGSATSTSTANGAIAARLAVSGSAASTSAAAGSAGIYDPSIPPLPITGVSLTVSTGNRGLTLTAEARSLEVTT